MEEQTSTQTGRKTIDEIKAITDPVEYALAAADYFSIRPVTIPQSFLPETGLLSKQSVEFWQKAKAVPLCRTAGRITVWWSPLR